MGGSLMSLPLGKADVATTAAAHKTLRFGQIGYGYWGPLMLRNLARQENAEVALLADLSEKRLADAQRTYPGLPVSNDPNDVLSAPDIDAVYIATPLGTHFELARQALTQGKHVLVEKPLTTTAAQAKTLIALAEEKELILMVGH